MRTLLILGGLVVCVLLVAPSNGDQTESGKDGGGEKGTFDLREFFVGQNEGGISNGIDAAASSAIDQQAQLQPRRQEPSSPRKPGKRKKCPGCFSSLSVDDPIKLDVSKRIRRQEKQEPSSPRKPGKRKKCPGCFSSLSVDDPIKLDVSKRIRRQEKKKKPKTKPTKKPPLPNMYRLTASSPRMKRDKKPKPSKKPRLQGTDGLERKPKSDRPATRRRNESKQLLPNMFALMSALQPVQDFSTLEKPPKDEGRRERKKNGRKRSGEEKEERKTRKHHHHPEGKKEKKRKRTGSRSAIESSHIETKDLSDGKEVSERMKRQSDKGKKGKEQKEKWRVGSRSPIASLPSSKFQTDTVFSLA